MKMRRAVFSVLILASLGGMSCENQQNAQDAVVNVYTHRHYEADQQLFDRFTEQTGIKVNVVKASADQLIERLESEGVNSPADVLISVDAGRLHRAKTKDLLQPIESEILAQKIPAHLRDGENFWFGVTVRARVIAYAKDRVNVSDLTTYEALADEEWRGKVLVRGSGNIYNQSLLASIIHSAGAEKAKEWAEGLVKNMARDPKGGDRDQVKAIAAGVGDVAIVNTYYIGKLLASGNEEEKKAGEAVGVFFPNQAGRGAHVNVSGVGVTRHSPNKNNAIRFIEFLADDEAQKVFAHANYEYPVNPAIEPAPILQAWGEFKADQINLSVLGQNNKEAVVIFDQVGWK